MSNRMKVCASADSSNFLRPARSYSVSTCLVSACDCSSSPVSAAAGVMPDQGEAHRHEAVVTLIWKVCRLHATRSDGIKDK